MAQTATWPVRRGRRIRLSAMVLASSLALSLAPGAQAATATNAWLAKVGTGGVNGTATMQAFTTGVGNLALKLKGLKRSTTLPVTVLKTSCKGSTLLTLASIRTTSTGTAVRTSSLTAAQVTSIKKATTGTGKVAVRVGSGTTARCGLFAAQVVPAYIAGKITIGIAPSGIAVDPTGVWVTNWWDNTLMKINPTTNGVTIYPVVAPEGTGLEEIASGAGSLWVTTTGWTEAGALPGHVLRIDPASGAVTATISTGKTAFDIVVGLGAVWLVNYGDQTVQRIDPATNAVVATINVAYAYGVAVDATSVWVSSYDGTLTKIDPSTNQVAATIQVAFSGGYVATGMGSVWMTHPGSAGDSNGTVSRIDPATNKVIAVIPVGDVPERIVAAGGSVWIGLQSAIERAVVRINPATNTVMNRVPLQHSVYTMDATDHAVWAVHNLPFPEGEGFPPPGEVIRIGY